jgi:hypothetical protein
MNGLQLLALLIRFCPASYSWYLDGEAWWRPILNGTYQLQRLGKTHNL